MHHDGDKTLTARQALEKDKRRRSFINELQTFRSLQLVYMPGALRILKVKANVSGYNDASTAPEEALILTPSGIPASMQATACTPGLVEKEIALREGQCYATLSATR